MTSLERQLKKLAVPQIQALLGDQKQRASLLFDKSEAATIGKDALYAIGINGLQELENIDPKFEVYENSLFGEASQSFERMQHSKAVNEALDKSIAEFLIKLSPYFLLRAATKALEWLIYRYRIHFNNVDDILRAFLPYHSTPAFVKVIQTFKLNDQCGRWFWLQPLQERGAPLARSVLLSQCIKDPNLFEFMCTMVPEHLTVLGSDSPKSVRTVINFFTSIMVGSLQLGKIKETTILKLLPYLLGGFKSKCIDYKSSAYVLLGQITSTVQLEQSLMHKLIAALTKHPETQAKEMLMTLLVICQSQDLEQMQKRTAKHLCKIPGILEHLEILSHNYQTDKLMILIFARLVPFAVKDSCSLTSSSEGDDSDAGPTVRPQYLSLLQSLLHGSRLEDTVALRIAELLAEQYTIMKQRHVMEQGLEKIRELFAIVEKKYPTTLDVLAKRSTEDESLQELLASTEQNLILGLNHVSPEIRCISVEKLAVVNVCEDSLGESVISRLRDDSFAVVEAVLNLNNLDKLISRDVLVDELLKLIDTKFGLEDWEAVTAQSIEHLTAFWSEYEDDTWWQIYTRLLPFLLSNPRNRKMAVINTILKSKVANEDLVLKGLSKSMTKKMAKSDFGPIFCDLLSRQSTEYREKLIGNLMFLLNNEEKKRVYQIVVLHTLTQLIPHLRKDVSASLKYSRYLIDIVIAKMTNLQANVPKDSVAESDSPSSLVLNALSTVISELQTPDSLEDMKWWDPEIGSEEHLFITIALDIIKLLSSYENKKSSAGEVCRKASVVVGESCLNKPMIYFKLMSAAFSGHTDMTPVHQLQCLYYAKLALTNAQMSTADLILSSENSTVPCLLMALRSEYQPIREAVRALMQDLIKFKSSQPYLVLCKRLLKVGEELVSSSEYLIQAMSTIFEEPSNTGRPRRKSQSGEAPSLQTALNDLLALIFRECPFSVKEATLTTLSLIQNVVLLKRLLPLMNGLLKKMTAETLSENETRCLHLLVHRFSPQTTQIFEESEVAMEIFLTCLRSSAGHHEEYLSVQRIALKQITKSFWQSLPNDELRKSILGHLFDIWVDGDDAQVNALFSKRLRSLPLNVEHISLQLTKLLPDTFMTVKDTKRVRRRSIEPRIESETIDNIFETKPWKRTTLVMEIIQSKKKMDNIHKLSRDLFALLKYAIHQENQSCADYFKQLVLSCLLVVYQKMVELKAEHSDEGLVQEVELDVELIIQCIRTSNSAQTHHHALILLSKVVLLEPERVLHNVMSIFTFMGTSIMQQDDTYSFKVLTDTIDNIIPALLLAHRNDQAKIAEDIFLAKLKIAPNLASSVKHILQVFVDAYPHMPQHRRHSLFEKLMSNLNANKFLWLLMVLMLDANSVRHRDKADQDKNEQQANEFCLQICDAFPINAKIGTAHKLLIYINTELKDVENKEEASKTRTCKPKTATSSVVLDFSQFKLKEVKMLKYALVGLVSQLLSGTGGYQQQGKELKKLVKLFEHAMEECLLFITSIGRAMSQESSNYWQALLTGAYKILDELQALLEHDVFVKVINGLIRNDLPIIRRKTMELLAHKLSASKFECRPEQVEGFLGLIPVLAKAARTSVSESTVGATVANRQAALLALRALCKSVGTQNPSEFQQLLPLVSKLLNDDVAPSAVISSAVALLSELITCLRAHAITGLSRFMPGLMKIFKQHRTQTQTTDTLLPNTVAAVQKIVEVLPNFISPYLYELLTNMFWLLSHYSDQDANQKMHVAHRLVNIRKLLSQHIPTRVLLPNLTRCYKELDDVNQWRAIQPIMNTLADHISIMSPDDVSNNNGPLLNLFLTALDFRSEYDDVDLMDIVQVENNVNEAFACLVMKLSETTFRPVFYRVYDWATNAEASKDRLLSFYHLCDCLASKMKNLFTKFAGHILPNVVSLLDANNSVKITKHTHFSGSNSTEKSSQLLKLLLDVLYKCFLYDNEGFVTKERFDTLMPPLILQLENMQGDIATYQDRISNHLVQTLVQLAVASGDDGSWKPLNYQVCLKTRHSNTMVRFAALQVVELLHDKLGTDYMSLLPETIQFLAELTEDENNEVEQKCHEVIKQMEKTLGEPLSKYF